VLLTAGAGGQTGWLKPFAFVRGGAGVLRRAAGAGRGVSDGHALYAAQALGCDLAYVGTRFIAIDESMARPGYKHMLADSSADDVMLTAALTGLPTNLLRPSIVAAGLDPDNLPARGAIDIAADISVEAYEARPKRWRDVWSAGHSVSGVDAVLPVADLVARTLAEYRAARGSSCQ